LLLPTGSASATPGDGRSAYQKRKRPTATRLKIFLLKAVKFFSTGDLISVEGGGGGKNLE